MGIEVDVELVTPSRTSTEYLYDKFDVIDDQIGELAEYQNGLEEAGTVITTVDPSTVTLAELAEKVNELIASNNELVGV